MEDLLPPEIAIDIFSRLPVESILQSRQVCKTWRCLLSGTDFVNAHLRRQLQQQQIQQHRLDDDEYDLYHNAPGSGSSNSGGGATKASFIMLGRPRDKIDGKFFRSILHYTEYDYNEFKFHTKKLIKKTKTTGLSTVEDQRFHMIIGSCNGLICFSLIVNNVHTVHILNPITGEQVKLPNFIDESYKPVVMTFGFGYLPSTNEYKVVTISYSDIDNPVTVGRVEVYTLGGGSGWRNKVEISACLCPLGTKIQLPGVLADGALHWLDYKNPNVIVAFDLANEEFFMIPPPPALRSQLSDLGHNLQALGGRLCVVDQKIGMKGDIRSLLSYKKNNKMKEHDCEWSLSSEFHMQGRPFAITKTGDVLLWWIVIRSKSNSCERLLIRLTRERYVECHSVFSHIKVSQVIPHVNSFVSLKSLGEKVGLGGGENEEEDVCQDKDVCQEYFNA